MRILGLLLIAAAVAAYMPSAIGQEAYTTRVETRPYYGAVVTIEHGVRVYRPVPPTQHMIIDPTLGERGRDREDDEPAPAEPSSPPDFE